MKRKKRTWECYTVGGNVFMLKCLECGWYYYSLEFMTHCFKKGQESMELDCRKYSKSRSENEQIQKLLCRAIKAVMDYEWGKDGATSELN